MQNLRQIQSFLRVAEFSSFKLAAEKSFVSTTAISKQIQALETQLGEQLFTRSTRRVGLTEFGEQYYQLCKKLEKNADELDEFVQSKKSEPQGTLKVLVQNSVARTLVLNRLKTFNEKYPKINLELEFSERAANIEQENIDVMLGYTQQPGLTDNLKYIKIMIANHILCASHDFIKQHGKPKDIHDLINFKTISHSLRRPDNIIKLADGKDYLVASPIIKMDSFDALHEACAEGLGILLTADTLAEEMLKKGRLVKILPDLNYRSFRVCIFYRPMNYEKSSVKAFVDFYSQ